MKRFAVLFFLSVMLASRAPAAEKSLGIEEFTSLNDFVQAISSYFPKIQGVITSVKGDILSASVGEQDGLKPGVILSLWREGKEIVHPETQQVLGRMEEMIGEAEVTDVKERSSFLKIIKKIKEPKQGDTARITPKKINIALVPLRIDRPEIVRGLAERLQETGRFTVLENEKVIAFLRDKKQRDSSLIKDMGRSFKLDVVTALEIYPSERGKLLITMRMFYADDARLIDTVTAMLDLASKKETFADIKPFFASDKDDSGFFSDGKIFTAEEKGATKDLPFDAQLLAVGDLEGTGILRYVFSDGARLHIYRQESAGWREEWAEVRSFIDDVKHLHLDVGDINGNGKPEIFVTAMVNEKVISYVMEFQGGMYQRIAAIPGFVRVLKHPGKGIGLIGQSYNPVSFFEGKPRQYTWSDGRYVVGSELALPKSVGLYGFVYADMGDASPFLVALNDANQLVVYVHNNAIWKSADKYPFVGVTVDKPLTGVDAALQKDERPDLQRLESTFKEQVKLKGRILALDISNTGRDEVIVAKNIGTPYLWYLLGYDEAEMAGLSWTGTRLDQRWTVKDIPGVVLDFHVQAQQGGGAQIIALVNTPGGPFKKDRVKVMSYMTTTTK
ncbi:MAG: VCBS repeat-containing protein [Nitrospirota bacterium]